MVISIIHGQARGFVLGAILLMACSVALAAPVTAKLDRNSVVVGETVTLILQTTDTDQSLDNDLSALQADFDVLNQRSVFFMGHDATGLPGRQFSL